jgi:hypothetical protein
MTVRILGQDRVIICDSKICTTPSQKTLVGRSESALHARQMAKRWKVVVKKGVLSDICPTCQQRLTILHRQSLQENHERVTQGETNV